MMMKRALMMVMMIVESEPGIRRRKGMVDSVMN